MEDFDLLEKQAPDKDRWHWLVHNFYNKSIFMKPEDFHTLVETLNLKYNTENKILEYLLNLNQIISSSYHRSIQPPIIDCWVRINPKPFILIRKNYKLWEQIPEIFKNNIDSSLCNLDNGFIIELAKEVLKELPDTPINKTENFIRLLGIHPIEKSMLNLWISELLEKGNSETRNCVVSYLGFIFKNDKDFNSIIMFSEFAISKEAELESKMIQSLFHVVYSLKDHKDSIDEGLLSKFQKKLLKRLKDTSRVDLYAQELLDFTFQGIDSVIDFIEYRIQKFKVIKKNNIIMDQNYELIPFSGIECFSHHIKSSDDYEKLIDNFILWYRKDDSFGIRYYLSYGLKSIKTLLNSNSKRLYLVEYIERQVEMNNIEKAITASKFLPFDENTINIFIKVAEKSIESGKSKDIEELFFQKLDFDDGWISEPGETPPVLLAQKDLFQKIYENINPGKLRITINKCIEEIDREIEREIKSGEEFLNRRE